MINEELSWKQIQAGDEKAYERLFFLYYAPLCGYANRFLRDTDEAENIVQELFCFMWEQKDRINISLALKPYLYRAVYNRSLNRLKQMKRTISQEEEAMPEFAESMGSNADQPLAHAELDGLITGAINAMPEKRRQIFCLSRMEQKTYKEIAAMLDISIKTVEAQMGKALDFMRFSLGDYLPLFLLAPAYSLIKLCDLLPEFVPALVHAMPMQIPEAVQAGLQAHLPNSLQAALPAYMHNCLPAFLS
ncbi:MAG: RNA polymerase sigma-70 factor [Bacteroidota bacterium]